jgi:polyhydroxybutyrate depolymerase
MDMRRFRGVAGVAAVVVLMGVVGACSIPPPGTPTSALDGIDFPAPERSPEPSPGCSTGATLPAERQTWNFEQDGQHRFTFVDAPGADAGYGSDPRPVILSLHPFALGSQAWDDYSKFAATGTARGYVVVTPQGSTDLLLPRWTVRGGLPGSDDPAFIDQVLARLGDDACIDLSRIYATGFSAGAAFAATLTCERPGLLAGIAVSGGSNLALPCPAGDAVDALIMHGRQDPIAPVTGQAGPLPPQGISVQQVVDSYATRGGCTATTTVAVRPTADLIRSTGCVPGGETAYLPFDGGHTWPGKDGLAFAAVVTGPTNYDFDATLTALDWFDNH